MKIVYFTLPSHWASALINSDDSGYTDRELKDIDTFLLEMKVGHCLSVSEDTYFSHYHDASFVSPFGCDVSDYAFEAI